MLLLPDLEIRAYLSRYLSGSLDLDAFESWFIPATWDVERYSDSGAHLAAEVRSALFAISTGEASEDDFRALAREKVNEVVLIPEDRHKGLGSETETHDDLKPEFA